MKQHTARPIPWHHGTVSRGPKCFVRSKDKVPCGVGTMMDAGLGDIDREAAPGIILGSQAKWVEQILLLLPTQHTTEVPQCGGALFPKIEYHAQALLGHERTGLCQV